MNINTINQLSVTPDIVDYVIIEEKKIENIDEI